MGDLETSLAHNSNVEGRTTFRVPPHDGSLVFPQLVDYHLEHNPDHPYCVLVGQGNDDDVLISWGEVSRSILRLAAKLREEVKVTDEQRKAGVRIAILANTDALTYCTMVYAVIRAGFTVFPLSPRNSVPALEHLVKKTSSSYLFGSVPSAGAPSSALQETTADVLKLLPDVRLLDIPTYTDLYPRLAAHPATPYDPTADAERTPQLPPVTELPEYAHVTKDTPVIFLHSSGSTAFPKPIPMSHRFWSAVARSMVMGDYEATGMRWGLMGLPGFHGMGVCLMVGTPASWGTISVMFKPSKIPLGTPSPEKVLECCKRGKSDYLFSVPSFFVDWTQDAEALKYLATMKGVLYGGGPLAKEIGDQLVKAGVNVGIAYGTTEVGLLFKLALNKGDPEDWNYGEFYPAMKMNLVPEANNLRRLVVLESDEHPIAVSNVDGMMAYDTNDLLEQHPTKKHLWKIIGRADDQIMMSNGEKTNPGPMENIINGNPYVNASLVFGRARTQVGIAIEPAAHVKITTDEELASFRNLIWPDIEKANAFAPQHSRIFKEFILVVDGSRQPFIRTPKGTISRNISLQQYATQIDALYAAAEQPTKADWAEPPETWDEDDLHSFVVRVVNGVMRREETHHAPIDELRDLFEQGCDSLQATYIRAAIANALRQAPKPNGKPDVPALAVPQNLVFSYPTVNRLWQYMSKSVASLLSERMHPDEEEEEMNRVVQEMEALVDEYSQDFPVHAERAKAKGEKGEVVLLTGSTGGLGTYLLERLLRSEKVQRVYALNRAGKNNVKNRQREAFLDRGVDLDLLESDKLTLMEVDVLSEKMGLEVEAYDELCDSVTTIIHNAWRLDFNLTLSSFHSNIRSTRSLIDIALRSSHSEPPRMVFISSIGTLMKWDLPRPVPEQPVDDPRVAASSGYTQSKWVAERILRRACEERGLRATIWRVGQLAGSKANGAWNTSDWLPLAVKSGERMGVLPTLNGVASWVPVDDAAQSIVNALGAFDANSERKAHYLHLVHPHPVSWATIFCALAGALYPSSQCKLVSYEEWLSALQHHSENPTQVAQIPAIKLLHFFKGIGESEAVREAELADGKRTTREAMGVPDLETVKSEERSPALRAITPLGQADVGRWVGYWRARGFLSSA